MARQPDGLPETPGRAVKIADQDWSDLAMDAASRGIGRSSIVRRLIRLYLTEQATRRKVLRMEDPVHRRNPSVPRNPAK